MLVMSVPGNSARTGWGARSLGIVFSGDGDGDGEGEEGWG